MQTIPAKPALRTLLVAVILLQGLYARAGMEMITFDDMSVGQDGLSITNGYAGLQWNNFYSFNAAGETVLDGYWNGMVSPDVIALNAYGNPASMSCAVPFDLDSAYVTAQLFDAVPLQVTGYDGPTLVYSNTYVINHTAPTRIDFNFAHVTSVNFTPPSTTWFALDDLTVTTSTTNSVGTLPGPANLGHITIYSIGHANLTVPTPGPPSVFMVRDSLIDQTATNGNVRGVPRETVNFDTNNQFSLTLTAPPGQQFWIHAPSGRQVYFGGRLQWVAPGGGVVGLLEHGSVAVSFTGLQGAAPDFSGTTSALADSHQLFGFDAIQSAAFSNDVAFTSITFTGTVPATNSGAASLVYKPLLDDLLSVYYYTTQTNDPGHFVSLIPNVQLAPAGSVNIGNVSVSTIGHTFLNRSQGPGPIPLQYGSVVDFLIDQDQSSGGGAIPPSFSGNFDTNNQMKLTVSAPLGMKFLVQVPAGSSAIFDGEIDWRAPVAFGPSYYGIVGAEFGGLEGKAPDFCLSSSTLSQLHGFIGFNGILSSPISGNFAFTSLTLTATLPATNVGVGVLSYQPDVDGNLALVYYTSQTNDPGKFVSIVPINQPLPSSLTPLALNLTFQPNGDLNVAFGDGTLQSASDFKGVFHDVPGNPSEILTVPKTNSVKQQFFRVVKHN